MSYCSTMELANALGEEAIKELLQWKSDAEEGNVNPASYFDQLLPKRNKIKCSATSL